MPNSKVGLEVTADVKQVQTFTSAVDGLKTSADGLYRVLGQVGAIYAIQRGFAALVRSGSDIEEAFARVAVTAGGSRGAVEAFGRAAAGSIYGPLLLAAAMNEAVASGRDLREVWEGLPGAIDWATASSQDLASATGGLLATADAFNLDFSRASTIADAFAAAMQRGVGRADQLGAAMAEVGPTARLVNQDFREMLAAVGAMNQVGLAAGEGATTLKFALIELANPSQQACELMKALGLELYDSSGRLKQWSDLVAEFERRLGGLSDQARVQALMTIFGTRGIQAMVSSLETGSHSLRRLVGELELADGTALRAAQTMRGTFAGATRVAAGNTQRFASAIFGDVQPALAGLLAGLNALMLGFTTLDPEVRGIIELLAGSAGLSVAAGVAYRAVTRLLPALGISMATAGWVTLIVGAIGAAVAWRGAQIQAARAAEEHDRSILSLAKALEKAEARLKAAKSGTEEYKAAAEELARVKQEIAEVAPEVVSAFDAEGKAVGILTDKYRELARAAEESTRGRLQQQLEATRQQRMALLEQARQYRLGGGPDVLGMEGERWRRADALEKEARELAAEERRIRALLGGEEGAEEKAERVHPPRPGRPTSEVLPWDPEAAEKQEEAIRNQIALFDHLVAIGDRRVGSLEKQLDWLQRIKAEVGSSWELEEAIAKKRDELMQAGVDAYQNWLEAMKEADLAAIETQVQAAQRGIGARIDALKEAGRRELEIRREIAGIEAQLDREGREEQRREFETELADLQAEVEKTRAELDREIAKAKSERVVEIVGGERRLTWDRARVEELETQKAERLAELEQRRQDLLRDREKELHRQAMEDRKAELQERLSFLEEARDREAEMLQRNLELVQDFWDQRREVVETAYQAMLDGEAIKQQLERQGWEDHYRDLLDGLRAYLAERQRLILAAGAAFSTAAAFPGTPGGGALGAPSATPTPATGAGPAAAAGGVGRGILTLVQNVQVHLPDASPQSLRNWGLSQWDVQYRNRGYFDYGGRR